MKRRYVRKNILYRLGICLTCGSYTIILVHNQHYLNNYCGRKCRDKHKCTAEQRRKYKRKYNFKSPKKTLEEDLAWMYDAKAAFMEDTHRTGKKTGGTKKDHRKARIMLQKDII